MKDRTFHMLARRRPFSLSQALILIGATAIGFGMARAIWQANEFILSHDKGGASHTYVRAPPGWGGLSSLVSCWALALILMRSPSARFRASFRRPGFMACVAIVLVE